MTLSYGEIQRSKCLPKILYYLIVLHLAARQKTLRTKVICAVKAFLRKIASLDFAIKKCYNIFLSYFFS